MARSRTTAVRTVVIVSCIEMLIAVAVRGSAALSLADMDQADTHRVLATAALAWLPVQAWAVGWLVRDHRATRREQASSDHMLRALASTTHDWLWAIDRRGVITYSSPGCRELFGYEPEDLVGRPAAQVIHPNATPESLAECMQAVADGTGWTDLVIHCIDKDGRDRYTLSSAVPIVDSHGQVVGHQGASRGLSDEDYQRVYGKEVRRRVEEVMRSHGLEIALQPIVSLPSDQVTGVEALARFSADPQQSPDRWFADARTVGLGTALELYAVRRALALLDSLPSWIYLSINASPPTIGTPELMDILTGLGAAAPRVVIEITEHESIEDYAALSRAREQMRALGVRLAVDDAGAGFASFRHILRLQPDLIKLDRGLISGIDTDLARRALASSVVLFALEVGAQVVAEGVETEAELAAVQDLAIDAVQGYYIGRPSLDRREWERWSVPRLHLVAQSRDADTA